MLNIWVCGFVLPTLANNSYRKTRPFHLKIQDIEIYYISITDTTLELSVFWPSDTESRINELRFCESISLSFKTRHTSVICFCGDVSYSKLQAWNQRQTRKSVHGTRMPPPIVCL